MKCFPACLLGVALSALPLFAQQNGASDKWSAAMAEGDAFVADYEHAAAVKSFRAALVEAERFGESDRRLIDTLSHLANACWIADECDDKEAAALFERANGLRAKAASDDDKWADTLACLADTADTLERYTSALEIYGEVVAMREKRHGPKHASVAQTYAKIAWVYHNKKDPAQARTTFNHALSLLDPAGAKPTEDYAALVEESGRLYNADDKLDEARREFDRALALYAQIWRESDKRFVEALQNAAGQAYYWDDASYAEGLYKRAAAIQKQARSERSEEYYAAVSALAAFYQAKERWSEAEAEFAKALAVRNTLRKADAATAGTLYNLAEVRKAQSNYRGGVEAARQCLEIRRVERNTEPHLILVAQSLLIELYARAEMHDEADKEYKSFADVARKDYRYTLGSLSDTLGDIYLEQGDYTRAEQALLTAAAIYEAPDAGMPKPKAERMRKLAKLYEATGRPHEAEEMNQQALALEIADKIISFNSGEGAKQAAVWLLVGLFVLMPVVATIALGTWVILARRLDRSIASLYVPLPPAPAAPASVETDAVDAPLEATAQMSESGVSLPPELTAEEQVTEQPQSVLEIAEIYDEAAAVALVETVEAEAPAAPVEINGAQQLTIETPEDTAPETELPVCEPTAEPVTEPAAAAPEPVPLSQFGYNFYGDGSTLFEIRIRNLLVSLLTLGLYSFWGKARVRRYLCGQIEFAGDRFAFHGTGKELLFGWLRAVPFFAFILLFPNLLPIFWETPQALVWGQMAVFAAMLLLWPVAVAGAYRYRLNRMSWRGIRFSFRGSTLRYLLLNLASYIVNVLSLGLSVPFFHVRTERMLTGQTYFGDRRLHFTARGRRLMPRYLCAVPLAIFTFGLFWPWYSALRSRYYWSETTFAGARFRCTATGWKLLRLWTGNFFLVLCTLGFGASWATSRSLRFWSGHLHLAGFPQLASVRQDAASATAVGESFADFLGFDFGL